MLIVKNKNMKQLIKRIFFILFVVLVFPRSASATILFQDNFDNCTSNCSSSTISPPNSASWDQWFGGGPVTVGGVSHYAGEISSPGRNGTGKSLKVWRNGTAYGYNGQYTGPLHKNDFAGSGKSDIYLRYYMKWPSAMSTDGNTTYLKQWRIITTNPDAYHRELYLNITPWYSSIQDGELRLFTSDGQCWHVLLNPSALKALFDDKWHSWEFHIDLANDDLQFWVDGISKYQNTSAKLGGYNFDDFTHFPIGNNDNPVAWQSSWQAVEVDDLVVSTSYVGPEGGTPSSDTTPPIISDPQPSTVLPYGTTSTNMRVTTNESATCKYGTGNVSYASMSNTFTSTGGTSHSKTLAGLSNGSSTTYYVRCIDNSNNANTTSAAITVNVSSAALINGTCGIASGQSFSSLNSASSNLCASGTVTSFLGSGPWTWGCNGINGGSNTSANACSASKSGTSSPALFTENFDNNSFSSRGWYDNYNHGIITNVGCQAGSCLEWSWAAGATNPTNGGTMRKKFAPTDKLYVSFYAKFPSNWRGSQKDYHPHMINILSDLDSDYSPLAGNYLNTYIEFVSDKASPYSIRPSLALQDTLRTNTGQGALPNNLTSSTENRSVNYCNGYKATQDKGQIQTCYDTGGGYWYSATGWKNESKSLSLGEWHKVEVYFEMNSINNNVAQANGVMKEWVDGQEVINHSNIIYRTAQDAAKKWAQFDLAPWIGDGSPIAQKMWLDELTVSNSLPGGNTDTTPPVVPSGLRVE